MKKFIYSLIAFSGLIVSIYFLISFIVKPENIEKNDFMAAIIDKHKRIEQLKCPKIIFAGGSNLAFGLNSEEVETEFSVPVVNLGLHGGLGLNFMINELKNTIENKDVVFLSIEYFLDSEGIYEVKKNTSNNFKEAQKYYKRDLKFEILSDIDNTRVNMKFECTKENKDNKLKPAIEIYSRKAFNKYGDHIGHLEQYPQNELKGRLNLTYSYWSGIKELNEFNNFAKRKNVAVFFIYPNFPVSEFNKNIYVINNLSMDLSKNLNIEILNNPSDFVFQDSLFFDTIYHLNKVGREVRTKKLIEIIKRNRNAQQKIDDIRVVGLIDAL